MRCFNGNKCYFNCSLNSTQLRVNFLSFKYHVQNLFLNRYGFKKLNSSITVMWLLYIFTQLYDLQHFLLLHRLVESSLCVICRGHCVFLIEHKIKKSFKPNWFLYYLFLILTILGTKDCNRLLRLCNWLCQVLWLFSRLWWKLLTWPPRWCFNSNRFHLLLMLFLYCNHDTLHACF